MRRTLRITSLLALCIHVSSCSEGRYALEIAFDDTVTPAEVRHIEVIATEGQCPLPAALLAGAAPTGTIVGGVGLSQSQAGMLDALGDLPHDDCPDVSGPRDNRGCLRFVRVVPADEGIAEIVILTRIEFATDESGTLLAVTVATLEEVRIVLEANPQIRRVAVEGHTDERATDSYNMALSRERADAVVRWLVAHGIAPSRLEARGFGEREPFASGTSLDAQQTNRNVQFFVIDPPASRPSRQE